jgi:putative molybdopterin biosynthesis protein
MVAQLQNGAGYMSVKQVAAYLQLNEKKVYTLVNEGKIPATKITGKWMFPQELVDKWLLDSAHGGVLTDRLIIAGSDDPLLFRIINQFARDTVAHALLSYTPTGTRLGLELLQARRVDACGLHWGPNNESHNRHPALMSQFPQFRDWVLIRAFRREHGLIVAPGLIDRIKDETDLFAPAYRWAQRQPGAGAQRLLLELLGKQRLNPDVLTTSLIALSEREAAAAIAMDQADVAPGVRAAATEFGLAFIPCGWEAFDIALPRRIWFRRLFQDLIARLKSESCAELATSFGGYDLTSAGELVWGDE